MTSKRLNLALVTLLRSAVRQLTTITTASDPEQINLERSQESTEKQEKALYK